MTSWMELRSLQAQHHKSLWNMIKSWKRSDGFWDDVNGGYLPEDLVLTAKREESECLHSQCLYDIVTMQDCKDADKKLLE